MLIIKYPWSKATEVITPVLLICFKDDTDEIPEEFGNWLAEYLTKFANKTDASFG
jgi:hypothetical protein